MSYSGDNVVIYKPTTFWLLLIVSGCIVGAAVFAILPAIWIFNDPQGTPLQISLLAFGVAIMGFALWGAPKFVRDRIEIHPDRIRHQGALSATDLHIDEIEGYRIIPTQYIETLLLLPKSSSLKKIQIALIYERKAELLAWLAANLVSLDERDRKQTLKSIISDEHLGSNKDERLRKLADARKWTRTLNFLGFVAIGWGIFYPNPYGYALGLLLALPPAALLMMVLSRGLIRYDTPKSSSYPNVAAAFMMPPIALLLRALIDWHFTDWHELLPSTVLLGAALTLALWIAATDIRKKAAMLVFGAGLCFLYAHGAAAFFNCFHDRSEPLVYEATITDQRITRGKQTSYYLTLDPFVDDTPSREVQVPADIYHTHRVGGTARIYHKQGRLGASWFFVR